ncbi:hypothetical protein D3C74_474980 [compost metagenome]
MKLSKVGVGGGEKADVVSTCSVVLSDVLINIQNGSRMMRLATITSISLIKDHFV